jgi:hypothetical protein
VTAVYLLLSVVVAALLWKHFRATLGPEPEDGP